MSDDDYDWNYTADGEPRFFHDALNRFINARVRAVRAKQALDHDLTAQRHVYTEQYRRFEAIHARYELFRRTAMHLWNEGHEAACANGRECGTHLNPYVLDKGTGDE